MSSNNNFEIERGSSSHDEMAMRMHDAGYEDWEISEEMDLKEWAEKTVHIHTEQFGSKGKLEDIDPNRIDAENREHAKELENELADMRTALGTLCERISGE